MQVTQFILMLSYTVFQCKTETINVGDENADIRNVSYSAFLGIFPKDVPGEVSDSWICGSSIITQHIVLTAGHCLYGCKVHSSITVTVGDRSLAQGVVTTARSFVIHDNFSNILLKNDIALVRLKTPLIFNTHIQRVALMEYPPYEDGAIVAGWGVDNVDHKKYQEKLHFFKQYVWQKEFCMDLVKDVVDGTFCARSRNSYSLTSDGSPLVVRGYIQIGLVSSKTNTSSESLAIYTDVGYFYRWIQENSKTIMCH